MSHHKIWVSVGCCIGWRLVRRSSWRLPCRTSFHLLTGAIVFRGSLWRSSRFVIVLLFVFPSFARLLSHTAKEDGRSHVKTHSNDVVCSPLRPSAVSTLAVITHVQKESKCCGHLQRTSNVRWDEILLKDLTTETFQETYFSCDVAHTARKENRW